MAASAYQPIQDRAVADAARLNRIPDDAWLRSRVTSPGEAQRLTDEARAAFASRRNVLEAFDLQLRAFGANPRDPEVASYLAFLYLKLTPPQPDMARQVALVALATRGSQGSAIRMDDWNTFAVASALSGRETDARNALFVTLAVSGNGERACLSALHALATQVPYRVLPLTDLDAAELVRSVRAAPLLFGYRGSEPVDVAALEDLLLRVAAQLEEAAPWQDRQLARTR